MTISDRRLDKLRLGELEPEEAKEVIGELEERGELHRLDQLEDDAAAFLESHPPGPAVQRIREELRRDERTHDYQTAAGVRLEPRSTSPAIVGVGALALVCLLALFYWPSTRSYPHSSDLVVADAAQPFIEWKQSDVECAGRANCERRALREYRAGKALIEGGSDDLAYRYSAYAQLDRAQQLLERGGIDTLPQEMADVAELQAALKDELDTVFNQARINFLNYEKRKMHRNMADQLDTIRAHFPDERSLYYRWAVAKERKMKDDGVYPKRENPDPTRSEP